MGTREDALLRILRAAATPPRRKTVGALASLAALSYGVARRVATDASGRGWLRLCEAEFTTRQHLHWELTEAGGRHLAYLLGHQAAEKRTGA